MPSMDEHRFTMNITLPPQTTLAVTYDLSKRIERALSNIPEMEDMVVNVGSSGDEASGSIDFVGPNQARIIARLKKNGRATAEIVSALSDEIEKWHIDKMEMEFITKQGLFGSSMGSSSGLTIEVKGRDLEKMQRRVERTENMMGRSKTFYGIKTIPSALIPELRLEIDRERASLFGMNVQDISATLLAAIKGYVATKLREKEDEYDVRVRLRKEDRDDLSRIGELTVYSPFGRNIQLQQISELQFVKSLPEIRRIEGQRAYLITANVRGSFDGAIKETRAIFNKLSGPADELSMEITGETLQLQESLSSAAFALIFGIIIVYMILASQFESLVLPVITMTTVPMGLIGAIYGLFFTFQSLNSVSMQGMVMLIGLVVNSGIILVDRYNTARQQDPTRNLKELVIDCTGERLRAVVMTTLTTVLGMLPTAMAVGKNTIAPMSIAIVSGEMFRLVLTLFFVPSSYLLIEEFIQRRKNRAVKSENIQ
jgi:HAE1 family hydrophobic/amphiphilic exporter-1